MTAVEQLPATMRAKIILELCPAPHLPGFCWAWTGAFTSRGYGSYSHEGRIWSTHRLAYELLIGAIPDGLQIDHLCTNKRCCNPRHLEPVTGKVNCERTERAQKSRCVNSHPLAGPNLVVKRRTNGRLMRNCRVCALDAARRRRIESENQAGCYSAADRRRAEILVAAEEALREELRAAS